MYIPSDFQLLPRGFLSPPRAVGTQAVTSKDDTRPRAVSDGRPHPTRQPGRTSAGHRNGLKMARKCSPRPATCAKAAKPADGIADLSCGQHPEPMATSRHTFLALWQPRAAASSPYGRGGAPKRSPWPARCAKAAATADGIAEQGCGQHMERSSTTRHTIWVVHKAWQH